MKAKLLVDSIHCDACKRLIEMELDEKGVKATVDVKKKTVELEFDEKLTSIEDIRDALDNIGYEAKILKK
jgi:copper chaperone CopZ